MKGRVLAGGSGISLFRYPIAKGLSEPMLPIFIAPNCKTLLGVST